MRSLLTGLAFLVILWAVIPAVKRSLAPVPPDAAGNPPDHVP
jgi:hypothetical protein